MWPEEAAAECKHIRGKRVYDVAADVEQMHLLYGFSDQLMTTVTDNGSSFVKAFKMYQPADFNHEEGDVATTEYKEFTLMDTIDALLNKCENHLARDVLHTLRYF